MTDPENKSAVLDSFGKNAAAYATSQPHASGGSLPRLVELLNPQPKWHMLDIATGAGHTALTLAPFVAHVMASDLTPQMLAKTAELAAARGLDNIETRLADAQNLPFEADGFDLVTCRIAPHHFPEPERFVREAARVLRPGGTFALVDNIVPENSEADTHVNAIEKRRDPSHQRCLKVSEWLNLARQDGLHIRHHEVLRKPIAFDTWIRNQQVPKEEAELLKAMIVEAPASAGQFFAPFGSEQDFTFHLAELILVARR
jgi:ubiquinone/menaquinone biosynthesis C-methylase UbiE